MSILTNIVAAEDDEIGAVGEAEHPIDEWSGIEMRDIDTAKIVALHALLTGDLLDDAWATYEPIYVSAAEGAIVLRLADELAAKLAELDEDAVADVGAELAATEAFEATAGHRDRFDTGTDGDLHAVLLDVVGGDAFDACSRSMAWGGRLLVVGFASGTIPQFPVNLALVKGYSVVGIFWGSFTSKEPAVFAENMKELMRWYVSGKVKPLVEAVYPLEKAADALKFIHDRKAVGKVVLRP